MNTDENKKKTTEELMETILKSRKDIKQLITELEPEQLEMDLKDYFSRLLSKKQLTPAQAIKQSGLSANYAHQIINGRKTNISRNKLLALAFGMHMTLEETQQMLKIARQPILYPRVQFDLILIFALKERWSLIDTNELLEDLQEPLMM